MSIPKKPDINCDFCGLVKTECTCNRFKYNRLCHYCNLVEDENHFLLKCPIYDEIRSDLFNCLSKFVTFDLSKENDECFILLMNNLNGDPELSTLVCEFVDKSFELRKKYLEPFEVQNEHKNRATCTRSGRLSKPRERLIESIA